MTGAECYVYKEWEVCGGVGEMGKNV